MIKIEEFWIQVIHFPPMSHYGLLSAAGQKSVYKIYMHMYAFYLETKPRFF